MCIAHAPIYWQHNDNDDDKKKENITFDSNLKVVMLIPRFCPPPKRMIKAFTVYFGEVKKRGGGTYYGPLF